MYLVVSKWAAKPGQEEEFKKRSRPVRDVLRSQPGVVFANGIFTDTGATAVHAYESEEAYHRVVDDPNGAFVKALAEHGLEEVSEWISSERGETMD